MLELQFEIEGDQLLYSRLEGIAKNLADWKDTFVKTGEYLKKSFKDNFEVQGALLGKPWQPLKPATIAFKLRKGYPRPYDPLIATGRMMESFADETGKFHVRVYNPIEYFKYHQSNKPRRVIPRRVMIHLTAKMQQQIVKFFGEKIQDKLKARG